MRLATTRLGAIDARLLSLGTFSIAIMLHLGESYLLSYLVLVPAFALATWSLVLPEHPRSDWCLRLCIALLGAAGLYNVEWSGAHFVLADVALPLSLLIFLMVPRF